MKNTEEYTQAFPIAAAEELYDLSMLEEMDDNEYVLELLTILLQDTPVELKEMKEAVRAGKADIVCQKAHKLKSSAGIIQADKLNALLADIETMGKKGSVNNELICQVENAVNQYYRIEKALKIYVQGLK